MECAKRNSPELLSHYFIRLTFQPPDKSRPGRHHYAEGAVICRRGDSRKEAAPEFPTNRRLREQGSFQRFSSWEGPRTAVHWAWLSCGRARVGLEIWILHREFCSGVYMLAPPPPLPPLHSVQPWHQGCSSSRKVSPGRVPKTWWK